MIAGQSGNRPTNPTKTKRIDCMHLKLLLPDVKTDEFSQPKKCPRAGCTGMRFYRRQIVQKKIVDTQYKEVSCWRYQCAKCGCTFRIYPKGVNHNQTSKREQSVLNLSRLIAFAGSHLACGLNLADLMP
jgi:hypothetical protein